MLNYIQLFLVAKNTFKEILQAKILFSNILTSLVLAFLVFVATKLTYSVPQRVAIDIGMGLLTISSVAIALSLGAGLLSNEIHSRTIYVILARSVPRHIFIWGKFIGLLGVLACNVLTLGLVTVFSYYVLGGKINSLIIWNIIYILLESCLVLSLIIFFSLITNKILAVLVTVSLYIMGHAVDSALSSLLAQSNAVVETLLKSYKFIFPEFYKLNLKDYIIYEQNLSSVNLEYGLYYGITYILSVMLLSGLLFKHKNFD